MFNFRNEIQEIKTSNCKLDNSSYHMLHQYVALSLQCFVINCIVWDNLLAEFLMLLLLSTKTTMTAATWAENNIRNKNNGTMRNLEIYLPGCANIKTIIAITK